MDSVACCLLLKQQLSLSCVSIFIAGLCMKVTSHINELLVAHVMHVGTNATDEGW
jgi:hypothetical protein